MYDSMYAKYFRLPLINTACADVSDRCALYKAAIITNIGKAEAESLAPDQSNYAMTNFEI